MTSRRRHTFEMALPLLAVTVAIVGAVVAVGVSLSLMDVERPASAALAVLGDGVDEFSLQAAPVAGTLARLGQESDALMALAIFATAISLIAIILHLARSLRSVGDVRGFIRYVLDRIRLVSYAHRWGTIRDVRTGHPIPLARVTLVAADGRVVAKAVADVAGRYGFGVPLSRIAGTAVSLHVSKGGYYDYQHHGPLPMLTADVHIENVHLDPIGSAAIAHTQTSTSTAALAGVAFWVSMATVPLAATVAPSPLSFFLIAGLVVTTIGRLCGLALHYRS